MSHWLKKVTPSTGSFLNLFDFGFAFGTMALKRDPNVRNYPAYNNHSHLPSALCSLKSFQCVFGGAHHKANVLSKAEKSKRGQRE